METNADTYRVLPRRAGGVDFGAERVLIAEGNGRRVWWRKGHTAWDATRLGDGRRVYRPGMLVFQNATDKTGRRVSSGGSMHATIKRMHAEIATFIASGDVPRHMEVA